MSNDSTNQERAAVERDLRQIFEQRLPDMITRTIALCQHRVMPNHHFADASAECIELWREGHYIATVTMSQAIIDGITRFVMEVNGLPTGKTPADKAQALLDAKLITPECAVAIKQIWGIFRHDFHHMNPGIAQIKDQFKELAERNMSDLRIVEEEIFGFDIVAGRIRPKHPKYWSISPDGKVNVFLRCT